MRIDVIGVPLDLGAGLRGVDVGPSAVRHAGLIERLRDLGHQVADLGNLSTPVAGAVETGSARARYAEEVSAVCVGLRSEVSRILAQGATPLILGGDHSLAAGSIAGLLDQRPDARVLWLDAHADVNTPTTSPTGNVHGMPLAAVLGYAPDVFPGLDWNTRHLSAKRVAMIGLRSVDPGERALLRQLGICVFTIADVDRWGMYDVLDRALDHLGVETGKLHVSLDMDVVDPMMAPGVGTPVFGGMTIRETHLALETIAQRGLLCSMEVVEVNALRDVENQTGRLAADFILSAFGQTIL